MARKKASGRKSQCSALVSKKISKISHEGLRGNVPPRGQKVAAAINMTKREHPECAGSLRKKKK